jgi:hypothetical protein
LYAGMTDADVDRVVDVVSSYRVSPASLVGS